MKLLLTLIVVFVVAGSFYADYRWKRWMTKQREQCERDTEGFRR